MSNFGADRTIEQKPNGYWKVECNKCGVVHELFHDYQEASDWFTWHLETTCFPVLPDANPFEKDIEVL